MSHLLPALDRVGDSRAGEFQIAKAAEKIGMAFGEPGVELLDRVKGSRRLVMPDPRCLRGGKSELVHAGGSSGASAKDIGQ